MCNKDFAVNPSILFKHVDVLTGEKHNNIVCPYCNSKNVYDRGVYR